MEIHRIPDDIRFVNQIGQTLSTDEKIKLELSLIKLAQNTKFDQLLFWGRIEGTVANYYIAIGLDFKGKFEFPHKTFFYSANLLKFNQLPEINGEYREQVETFRQLFNGQPDKILINVTGEDGDQPPPDQPPTDEVPQTKNDDDSDVEVKPPPKNFTELDRLAYIVYAIEYQCAIVPVGAMRLTPAHELRYNDSFEGLNLNDSKQLIHYQHYRAPISEEKQQLIAKDDALFHYDFMDPLAIDKPLGQWSIQSDSSKYNITVRNLLWPGFIAYHRVNTKVFGYAYFGDGVQNVDLAFQL